MNTLDLQTLGLVEMNEEQMLVVDGGRLNFDFFLSKALWDMVENSGMRQSNIA